MKLFITVFIFFISCVVFSQEKSEAKKGKTAKARLNEKTIVKDSAGTIYPYSVWTKMLETLDYRLVAEDSFNKRSAFIIERASLEQSEKWKQQKENWIESRPPAESPYFETGKQFQWVNDRGVRDINGFEITGKWLKGKILVLNFWFIDCLPCRKEMPELDELAKDYAKDSSIVFLSVAPDSKKAIEKLLAKVSFSYRTISNGTGIQSSYGINRWPINLIVSGDGTVAFHAAGYSVKTVPWMRKVIEGLRNGE